MSNRISNLIRIGIFYDGYYFYKVSNYYKYEHERKARISISGLHKFIRNEVAAISGAEERQCQIIDAHYFKGRSSAKDMGDKVQAERIFEDILMRENIVTHYLPLRYNGESNQMQEKGIDVWLALEAYELAIHKQFDMLVLVACDGDYVPLVRKLNGLGTQVMLLSWDFSYRTENGGFAETHTSRQLLEEVLYPVLMHQRIADGAATEVIKNLFVFDRYNDYVQNDSDLAPQTGSAGIKATDEFAPIPSPQSAPSTMVSADSGGETEYESDILSLKPGGFGFIRDDECNNVFFHYSRLTNCEFDDLRVGMRVRYTRAEDAEQTKRYEDPRYSATRVTIITEADS